MASTWPDTVNETPDGARTTFTTTSGGTPVNELLFVDRILQVPMTDYSVSGSTITFTASAIPPTGAIIRVYYIATGLSLANPGVTSLGQVRSTIRQRADLVGSLFVTDPELNGWINSSYQELYDILVQKYGDEYYVADPYSFTTDGTTELYPFPGTLYKLLGVEVQDGSVWADVARFNFAERNRYGISSMPPKAGRTNLRYRPNGSKLWLRSGGTTPSAGLTVRLWFVPRLSPLVNDNDALDGVSGWEEYVVTDCVIKCKTKEESDPSVELALKNALLKRIEDAAENRDAGSPATVSDVRGAVDGWPNWTNPGGWD